ncbi:MAG TPA: NADH-quinone oxidoreductase subunit NuoH [Actinobacteria bacterium]|nr:NADH-quinone oxidoreductase subunit NuoH [Actinomycetota bacterium]
MLEYLIYFIPALVLTLVIIHAGGLVFPYLMRRLWGFMGDRHGPNRVGPLGFFQPIADGIKLFTKEDITPTRANKWVFLLAPAIAFATPMLILAVIPFNSTYTIADLNVGLIYIVAVGAFGVLGILLAGWSSNNKYSLVGGLRAAAQMISYEIPLLLTIVIVAMLADSLNLNDVVSRQENVWYIVIQPLAFVIFLVAGVAELNRTPFDLPEAESELVSGYMTEYSAMRFALFYGLVEWGNVTVWGLTTATLFLGGWHGPFLSGPLWLLVKVVIMALLIIWFFSTFPRLQVDQLMAFAWKILIPISILNLVATGLFITLWPDNFLLPTAIFSWAAVIIFIAVFTYAVKKILLRSRLGMKKLMDYEPWMLRKPAGPIPTGKQTKS